MFKEEEKYLICNLWANIYVVSPCHWEVLYLVSQVHLSQSLRHCFLHL